MISSVNAIRKIKELTIFEENLKDQVSVNQLLCVQCKQAIVESEKALAELNTEKNTIQGLCDASVKVDKIISSQRPIGIKNCLGFSNKKNDSQRDRFMLKFGMFVYSIPNPNASQCSSSTSTHNEGTTKNLKKYDKGKAKVDYPSKTQTPKLEKSSKALGSRSSVSETKKKFQNPTPRRKIDLTSKNKEKISIPPIANSSCV